MQSGSLQSHIDNQHMETEETISHQCSSTSCSPLSRSPALSSTPLSDVCQPCPWSCDVRHAGLRGALHLWESERPPLLLLASVLRGCQRGSPTPGPHANQYQKLHSHPRPHMPGETQWIYEKIMLRPEHVQSRSNVLSTVNASESIEPVG